MMILIEDAGALRTADTCLTTGAPSAVVQPPCFPPHPVYC
jgi:hypothetical protein